MVLGWPIGATLSARLFDALGAAPVLLVGALLIPLGALIFVAADAESSPVVAGLGSLHRRLRHGPFERASIVLIQEIVDWSERGSVTASYIFARTSAAPSARPYSARCSTSASCAPGLLRLRRTNCASCSKAATTAGDLALRAALEASLRTTFVAHVRHRAARRRDRRAGAEGHLRRPPRAGGVSFLPPGPSRRRRIRGAYEGDERAAPLATDEGGAAAPTPRPPPRPRASPRRARPAP